MARARNIKPGIFKNELLGVADPLLTLLFESLWCLADKAGRLEDRPLRIKAETFPYREGLDVNGYLTELQRLGFICRYVVDGVGYIQVVNFLKHQNPHKTERESVIPEIPEKSDSCALTVKEPLNNGSCRADSLIPDSLIPDSLIPDSLVLIPDSLIPDSGFSDPLALIPVKPLVEQKPLDAIEEIFSYWQLVMKSPKSVLDDSRRKIIEKALKIYHIDDILKAIRGCSKSPHNMGQNDQKTKYNGLGLILRNAEKIDRFIQLDSTHAVAANETLEQRNARIIAEVMRDVRDTDENTIEMEVA